VIRGGAFLLAALLASTAGCTEHIGALGGGGSDASLGGDARDMSVIASGDGPDGSGDAAACTCPTGLFVDVVGDGDPLHLTSADVGRLQGVRPNTEMTVATQCLSPPVPWVDWATGEISLPYYIEACAGPGNAPPCVLLNGDYVAPGSYGSSYVDRTGQTFRADATLTWSPPQVQLMRSFDGSYTLKLEDGRTLSGTFDACLIAFWNFA